MATIPSFDIDKYLKPKYDIKETGLANQKAYKKYLLAHILKGTEVNRSPLEMIGNLAKVYAGADLLKTDDDATKLLQEKAKEKKQISADYLSTALKAMRKPFTSPSEVEDVLLRKSIEDPETGTATLPEYQNVPKIYPKGTTENLIARLQNSKNPALQDYAKQLMPYAMQVKEKRDREDKLRELKLLRKQADLAEKRQYESGKPKISIVDMKVGEDKDGRELYKKYFVDKSNLNKSPLLLQGPPDKDGNPTIQKPFYKRKKGQTETITIDSKAGNIVFQRGRHDKNTLEWVASKKAAQKRVDAAENAKNLHYSTSITVGKTVQDVNEMISLLRDSKGNYDFTVLGLPSKIIENASGFAANVKGFQSMGQLWYGKTPSKSEQARLKERGEIGWDFSTKEKTEETMEKWSNTATNKGLIDKILDATGAKTAKIAVLRSNLIGLAFAQAIINNNGGSRISDKDFEYALRQIGGNSSDPRKMYAVLQNMKDKAIKGMIRTFRVNYAQHKDYGWSKKDKKGKRTLTVEPPLELLNLQNVLTEADIAHYRKLFPEMNLNGKLKNLNPTNITNKKKKRRNWNNLLN